MEPIPPLIRASNVQQNLKSLNMFDASTSEQIKQLISEPVISQIETSARSEWIPVELDIKVTEAVTKICGNKGLIDWSRNSTVESANGPLLGPLMKGAIRLFGITPAGIYKLGPQIWNSVYRHCGDPLIKPVHSKLVHLFINNVPNLMRLNLVYLQGIGGAFEAAFPLCKAKGTVKLDLSICAPTSICYVASWE